MKEELLYRYLIGETTNAENEEILVWLDADPKEHVKEMNRIRYICQAVDQNLLHETPAKGRMMVFRRLAWYISGAAASLLILIGMWYLGSQDTYNTISDRMAVVEVPAGQHIRMTLEDGTSVWLNAGTRLEYPVIFDRKLRQVQVSGEAIFEVTHNANQPFVVKTFASEIEVLGTKFDVRADETRNLFSTTLMEGSIKVKNLSNPSDALLMKPNDMVTLVNGQFCKSKVQDFADMCWTEGLIHLKSMPFDELMAIFERAFDIRIVLGCGPLPDIDIISGEIRVSDGVDNALTVLQQMVDFTYEHDYVHNIIQIK